MCLILFAINPLSSYRLIVAANRDEYYARPTRPAMFWPENTQILAGKDLSMGGTWMGITRSGRFAAITNLRGAPKHETHTTSRGQIPKKYLESNESPKAYLEKLTKSLKEFEDFNLLIGNGKDYYYFNSQSSNILQLSAGFYGLSNQLLNCNWPKVQHGKEQLKTAVNSDKMEQNLFQILSNTGDERPFSNSFIAASEYGTRSKTILTWNADEELKFTEKSYIQSGKPGITKHISFSISL